MKEPEEYINKFFKEENPHGDRVFFKEDIIKVIKQVQFDSWNEAVKECAENAEVLDDDTTYYDRIVDKKSILKLLKE